MTTNTGYSAESLLVIGIIVAAFFGFLLFFFIPAHNLILPILLGVAVLMLVVFSMCSCTGTMSSDEKETTKGAGSKPMGEQVPEHVPDIPKPKKDLFDGFLIAMAILFIFGAPFARLSFTADTYATMYLFFAVLTIGFYIIRNLIDVRIAKHDSQSIPDVKTQVYLPVLRTGLLLLCGFICAFFYFEIWKLLATRTAIPELVLVELAALLLSAFLVYRTYRSLNPSRQEMAGSPITNTLDFLTWVIRFFTGNFWGYIILAIILNGSIALIVLLAGNNTIEVDLTQGNGFILFIVFAFGNLLLFALVALKLDRIGKEPVTEEGVAAPVTEGIPQKYLNPKLSTLILGALMIGFLAVFFAVPMLALESGLVGGKTTDRDILLAIGQPDPSQVIITYNGGNDAARLVGMTAIVEVYVRKLGKGSGYQTIATGDLGYKTSKNPISIGNKIVLTGPFPEGSRLVIWGYFSDGKYQTLVDQPL